MEVPEFPIKKTEPIQAEVTRHVTPRRSVRRYVEIGDAGDPAAHNYDSHLDYWHVLRRYKLTFVSFALASLCAALLITLVQTPIYRVRTSLEIQSVNLTELKNGDSGNSGASYASAESYVETQVKLL